MYMRPQFVTLCIHLVTLSELLRLVWDYLRVNKVIERNERHENHEYNSYYWVSIKFPRVLTIDRNGYLAFVALVTPIRQETICNLFVYHIVICSFVNFNVTDPEKSLILGSCG